MRLWSIHPKYLDSRGLVAAWRESLLAKKVLAGKTKGYKHHPQLVRFLEQPCPAVYMNFYLHGLYEEARRRGYAFQKNKIGPLKKGLKKIKITEGQIKYEFNHLSKKLKSRDKARFKTNREVNNIEAGVIFKVIKGRIEPWEKINK